MRVSILLLDGIDSLLGGSRCTHVVLDGFVQLGDLLFQFLDLGAVGLDGVLSILFLLPFLGPRTLSVLDLGFLLFYLLQCLLVGLDLRFKIATSVIQLVDELLHLFFLSLRFLNLVSEVANIGLELGLVAIVLSLALLFGLFSIVLVSASNALRPAFRPLHLRDVLVDYVEVEEAINQFSPGVGIDESVDLSLADVDARREVVLVHPEDLLDLIFDVADLTHWLGKGRGRERRGRARARRVERPFDGVVYPVDLEHQFDVGLVLSTADQIVEVETLVASAGDVRQKQSAEDSH